MYCENFSHGQVGVDFIFDSSFTSNMWVFIHFLKNWLSFLLLLVQIDLYI